MCSAMAATTLPDLVWEVTEPSPIDAPAQAAAATVGCIGSFHTRSGAHEDITSQGAVWRPRRAR